MIRRDSRKRTETKTGRLDDSGRPVLTNGGGLIFAGHQFVRKYAFKSALFVLIVQKDHGSNSQRMPARVACRHFPLHVLQETIREMVLIGSAPRRFFAVLPAIGTGVFQRVLLRIAAQRRPTRISNPNSLFRRKTHDHVPRRNMETAYLMHKHRKLVHKKRKLVIRRTRKTYLQWKHGS
jgi:hypothetical protein